MSATVREDLARELYRNLYPGDINTPDSMRSSESDAKERDRAYVTWDRGREGYAPGSICRELSDTIRVKFDVYPRGTDWRVLGGVIPGPIPVEWVRVGDTIQDHGVKGTVSRIVRNGNMRHVYIDSGHVCFAKVAQQDFVQVTGTNHENGSAS